MIRKVFLFYSQVHIVTRTRGHNKKLFKLRFWWICENTGLLSQLCPNGIRCQLALWTHTVMMPSKIDKFWSTQEVSFQLPV